MKKKIILGLCVSAVIFSSSSGELIVENPEWRNGEEFSYEIRFKGELVGNSYYLIADTLFEETQAYMIKVSTITGYLGINTFDSVSLVVNQENLKPIKLERTSITPQIIKWIRARYLRDTVKIRIDTPYGSEEEEIENPKDGYDNEEIVLLLRALTQKEGSILTFKSVSTISAGSIPVEVRILKPEKVKVPLGEFICTRFVMRVGEKEVELWYQKKKPYLMVKYLDNDTKTEILLKEYK